MDENSRKWVVDGRLALETSVGRVVGLEGG
jgi:hypothetical protein